MSKKQRENQFDKLPKFVKDAVLETENLKQHTKVSKRSWIFWSFGTLITLFLAITVLSSQKLIDNNYRYTVGVFKGEDFYYTVDGKEHIAYNTRRVTVDNSGISRTRRRTYVKLKIQLVHYAKNDPREVHFAFARNGGQNLTSMWNWWLVALATLFILNFPFIKFAYREGWETYDLEKDVEASEAKKQYEKRLK